MLKFFLENTNGEISDLGKSPIIKWQNKHISIQI